MSDTLAELETGIALVQRELALLGDEVPNWDSGSKAGGKTPRALARRLVLAAQRLEEIVKQHTYSP